MAQGFRFRKPTPKFGGQAEKVGSKLSVVNGEISLTEDE